VLVIVGWLERGCIDQAREPVRRIRVREVVGAKPTQNRIWNGRDGLTFAKRKRQRIEAKAAATAVPAHPEPR
jgi:hypothetical protein